MFTAGTNLCLGGAWRIKARKSDFYFEPTDSRRNSYLHLSIHGPNEAYEGHRFHVKADSKASEKQRRYIRHDIPRSGLEFSGKQLDSHAYLVARIRWSHLLQLEKYRQVASATPPKNINRDIYRAARLGDPLRNNSTQDIDIVVSWGAPYWRGEHFYSPDSARDLNARLGPVENDTNMFITATSHHRSELIAPTPEGIMPPPPPARTEATNLLSGGIGPDGVYWLYHTIADRSVVSEDDDAVSSVWPKFFD